MLAAGAWLQPCICSRCVRGCGSVSAPVVDAKVEREDRVPTFLKKEKKEKEEGQGSDLLEPFVRGLVVVRRERVHVPDRFGEKTHFFIAFGRLNTRLSKVEEAIE